MPGGRRLWVVVDDDFEIQGESSAYLSWLLTGADRSSNTAKAYAGRIALFMTWADRQGVNWKSITLTQLTGYKRWLEETPLGSTSLTPIVGDRRDLKLRSGKTVNGHLTAVCEMLRFAARQGLVEQRVAAQLSEQRFMIRAPDGYNVGEEGQWRAYRARILIALEDEAELETLTDEQVEAVLTACRNVRDRFLVWGIRHTGLRIGEQLGLRRSDMHLLPSSRHLGCSVPGAHIHVVRRLDNDNHALAKSRHRRHVPVDADYVALYSDYRLSRDRVEAAREQDLVFANLYRAPLGRGLTYAAVDDLFERLSTACGFRVRAHMLRHTFATRLVEGGTAIDVVQKLLGHASLSSTGVYLHADEELKRAAVVAARITTGSARE